MLLLTVKQMEWTSNPAAISKLSRWTFAIQAIIDGYAFVTVSSSIILPMHASLSREISRSTSPLALCRITELRPRLWHPGSSPPRSVSSSSSYVFCATLANHVRRLITWSFLALHHINASNSSARRRSSSPRSSSTTTDSRCVCRRGCLASCSRPSTSC